MSPSAPSSSVLCIVGNIFFGVLTQFTSCILFTEDGVGFVGGIANSFSSFENVNHSVSSFQLAYNVAACLMATLIYFIAN